MSNEQPQETMSIRVPTKLLAGFQTVADKHHIPRSVLIRSVLWGWYNANFKESDNE